ncbi:MAG: acyl-ACP--UDP-N-acetylglucosamine O-acyltransferase [Myxococcota bacterium]
MSHVHPRAEVDPSAKLAQSAEVGAFATVGPEVELAEDTWVGPHAHVTGRTTVGAGTRIFSFAVVGEDPQDKSFSGETSELLIGRGNVIREHCSIHTGTRKGGRLTRIGDDNLFMNSVHVGHDAVIGSHCIVATFCAIAGHVVIEDHAVLGAYTGVHQLCRVGESAMAAGGSKCSQDVPPFSLVHGDRARLAGLNVIGMRRRNFSRQQIAAVKRAYHLIFSSKLRLEEALSRVREELPDSAEVERLLRFLESSERGFCR